MTDYSFFIHQTAMDPTRTATLRARWVADWNRRIKALQRVVWKSVVVNDCLGLKEGERPTLQAQAALDPADPKQWAYRWSHEKVAEFMKWLQEMESRSLLEIVMRDTLRPGGEPWSNIYVRSAYQRGLSMAYDEVRRRSAELGRGLGISEADFPPTFRPTGGAISTIMQQPFHADRLALAYTRVFDELKGVTAEMDKQISQILTRGIAEGLNPRDIGELLADRIEKIGGTRGRLIARTETIHVHQQAALNEYYATEQSTGETMLVEWKATMDARTRDTHAERNRRVYTKEEAYKLVGEPNCRCALLPFIPAVQGMPDKATSAARAAAERAVGKVEVPVEEKKAKELPVSTGIDQISSLDKRRVEDLKKKLSLFSGKDRDIGVVSMALDDMRFGQKGLLSLDPEGNVLGAVSYTMEDKFLSISNISSAVSGLGSDMMKELFKIAMKEGVGIEVHSIPQAMGFYKKVGLIREEGSRRFFLLLKEIKKMLEEK